LFDQTAGYGHQAEFAIHQRPHRTGASSDWQGTVMDEIALSTIGDIGSLPEIVVQMAGQPALRRIFADQELPIGILADKANPILVRDAHALYVRAAAVTGVRSFGLMNGLKNDVTDLGPLGNYVSSAQTFAEGLARAASTSRFSRNYSHQFCEILGHRIRFGYRNPRQTTSSWRHQGDQVICFMFDFARKYLGQAWRPDHIEVTYRKGAWEQDLEDCYGVPVHFDRPAEAIVFDRDWLSAPSASRQKARWTTTRSDVVRFAKYAQHGYVKALQETIRQRLLLGKTDFEGLAEKLAIGPRTLQGRLTARGTNYRELLNSEMNRRAIELLAEPALTVDAIADEIGYASRTQFIRAFKKQNSMTPTDFRRTSIDAMSAFHHQSIPPAATTISFS
jgi:AraC-like DNA-binding protein